MACEPASDVMASHRRIVWLVPIVTFLALIGAIIPIPVQVPADGHEYLATVASLIATHNLTFEREDMIESARLASPETFFVDKEVGPNTRINPWNGKRVWGSHSIYMAFAALPFVLLFGAKGFLVLNALCFALMMWFLYRHFADCNKPAMAVSVSVFCLVLSGALNYVFWINSEMLIMAMLFGALYHGLRFHMYRAMVFLGIASAIKEPLVVLFFLLALWHFVNHRSLRTIVLMGVVYLVTLLPHLSYNFFVLGCFGVFRFGTQPGSIGGVSKSGAGILRFVTWLRVWTFWCGPGTGMIWFYPAIFWCLCRTRFPRWMTAATLLAAVMVSVICLVPDNLISTGAGIRYNALVFPLVLFLGGTWRSLRLDWILMGATAFFGGPLLMDSIENTRTPEGVFHRPYPSMIPAQHWGAPLYPELLYHVGFRLPRGTVSDYLDDQLYVRNNILQVMIREVDPGEAIFTMLPVVEAPPHTVRYGLVHGPQQTKELRGGQMSTLTIPMSSEDFVDVAYPEWRRTGKHAAPTARFKFKFSHLDVISDIAELRWQRRYHGGGYKFLHQVGPRLLNVFPSRDWILRTISVEELEDNLDQPAQALLTSDTPDVRIEWDSEDKTEGSASVRIVFPSQVQPGNTQVFTKDFIDVGHPLKGGLQEVEAGGFFRLESLQQQSHAKGSLRVGVFVDTFDANAVPLQRAWLVRPREDFGPTWRYFLGRASLPQGAVFARVGFLVKNGVGALKVDGLVISWYQTPWQ